jgi:nitrite reductase (NADH) large subunit
MDIVIIGCSAAGLSCLDTLCRVSPQAKITIISAERYAPYSRCLLSYYLGNMMTEQELMISTPSSYPAGVRFILGQKVEKVDAGRKSVRLSNGSECGYDKLLLAVGADAVKPQYYDEEKRTFTLRYLDDTRKIAAKLKEKAVVSGGGFIGIKTAYGLLTRKIKTEMVISSAHLLALVLDESSASHIEKDLAQMGLGITTNDDIKEINLHKNDLKVSLRSGRVLDCDVVVAGKGVQPQVDLARWAGIKVNEGISVDEYLETSVPDIFAAGDCCETFDLAQNKVSVIGLWPVAVEQGYFAALNMTGCRSRYPGSVGMNSLKTSAFHLISAGVLKGEPGLKIYEKQMSATRQFRKLAFRGDVPVGMAFYNCPEEAGLFVNLIKKAQPLLVRPEKVVNGEVGINDILKPL